MSDVKMGENYKDYLAANVLSESKIVSYRTLSRALKVHVDAAKEMLHDFHRTQNAKRLGSVHATYLLVGTVELQADAEKDAEDSVMADSSFISAPASQLSDNETPLVPVTSVLVVGEEDLEDAKATFNDLQAMHIYSLEPTPLSDIQIVSDCNRKIASEYAHEDPLETWQQYGTIRNSQAKRRERRNAGRPAPTSAPSTSGMKPVESTSTPKAPQRVADSRPASSKSGPLSRTTKKDPPALTKETSSIFKSFGKAKTRPNLENPSSRPSSKASAAEATTTDDPMKDVSADEADDEPDVEAADAEEARTKAEASRKAKQEREEALRDMMDEDEEDREEHENPADTLDTAEAQPDQPSVDQVTVVGGRRRGRRRVMKKKTTKDAEGYLVTKEEPVWESFSEDEPPPPAPKPSFPSVNPKSAGSEKSKKPSKAGQGSIMSFFGKK